MIIKKHNNTQLYILVSLQFNDICFNFIIFVLHYNHILITLFSRFIEHSDWRLNLNPLF